MAVIKFCENNYDLGAEEVMGRIENELEDVDIEVATCLGYCGECAVGPFALVNDELVVADTPGELFDLIKEML